MAITTKGNFRACGTCQHYSWTLGPQRKTTCNNAGCIETTPACTDYSINPFILQDFEKVLKPLADVLRVMPITTLSMFHEIISQEKTLRRRGFYFMEKVAIKYWGTPAERFVSNYIIAHVYSATKEGVFLIAKNGTRLYMLRESILKLEEFLILRKTLKTEGKLLDPTLSSRASTKQKLAITETLDDVISRGVLDEYEFDTEIKQKLNPKKINRELGTSRTSAMDFSTKKKRPPLFDEAEEFIKQAEKKKSLINKIPVEKIKKEKVSPIDILKAKIKKSNKGK